MAFSYTHLYVYKRQGERYHARHAAGDDEHLQCDGEAEAGREQLAEVVLAREADAQCTADQQQVGCLLYTSRCV